MFDLGTLQAAVSAHQRVVRVVIAAHQGSSPREVGAAMLVWVAGQSGTIGGGALEYEAVARAREWLAARPPSPQGGEEAVTPIRADHIENLVSSSPRVGGGGGGGAIRLDRVPLGPALGQCCGGAVTLLSEGYDAAAVATLAGDVVARSVDGRAMPLAVKRLLAQARGTGVAPAPVLLQGWFIEPVTQVQRAVWVWGAGHVGRALVAVLAPLPGVAVTWVDIDASRFPDAVPDGVRTIAVADPADAVAGAPQHAEHLIVTFSHALDLELCHRLLHHGFGTAGVIGSATKWARFRARLAALGHGPGAMTRIDCPIGDPALGKHPHAIAIGVAARFLAQKAALLRERMLER